MPRGLAALALDLEEFRSRDVEVIQGFIRGLGPEDGNGSRSCAHSRVKLSWGSEGDISVPVSRGAWLKSYLGEGCYERPDGEDVKV